MRTQQQQAPPVALTATQVGELLGYTAQTIRRLTHQGRFPPPIDPDLHPKQWRWSHVVIRRYAEQVAS